MSKFEGYAEVLFKDNRKIGMCNITDFKVEKSDDMLYIHYKQTTDKVEQKLIIVNSTEIVYIKASDIL